MTQRRAWVAAASVVFVAGLFVGLAVADRSSTAPPLTYSGTILDATGAPVADGAHDVGLALFADATGGSALCTIAPASLTTTAGRFSLDVASAECGRAIEQGDSIFVELTIDGTVMPRTRAGAVPFAVNAERLVLHGASSAITTGLYCGSTPETTGRIRADGGTTIGYAAARRLCQDACGSPTAHMCSTDEMLRTFQLGRDDFGTGWVSTAYFNHTNALVDCDGWSQNLAGYSAMTLTSATAGATESPRGIANQCDQRRPVLCCD